MTSIKNIRNTLSETTLSLGLLCKSNNINKWSFRKPVNSESVTKLSDSELYNVNDGFKLYTFNSPQRMLYELQHENESTIWKYEERTEPYRLGDFDGYEHNAGPLCNLYFVDDNGGTPGSTLSLECKDLLNIIQHWNYFEGVRNNVDLIFLIYNTGTEFDASGMHGLYVYKIASVADYDGNGIFNFTIPNDLSKGQYEIRLCCAVTDSVLSNGECRYVNSSNQLNGTWYALPQHCVQTFTVNSGSSGTSTDYYDYLGIDFYNRKNILGAFKQPLMVLIDPLVLNTLDNQKDKRPRTELLICTGTFVFLLCFYHFHLYLYSIALHLFSTVET